MKKLKFWLFILLELSGPLFGIVMAISFVAGLIQWYITGNEHSIFEQILGIGLNYVMPIYLVWFLLTGLYSLHLLAKNNKN